MRNNGGEPGSDPQRNCSAGDPLAVVGMECCLPAAENLEQYEQLLFSGRSGIAEMPAERFDRELYFDPRRGQPGKSYTLLGGCVPERPPDLRLLGLSESLAALYDPVHLRFSETAIRAWRNAQLPRGDADWQRTGVYVGHSGATKNGGGLNFSTHAEEALDFLNDVPGFQRFSQPARRAVLADVLCRLRSNRPGRRPDQIPRLNGYSAAALTAQLLNLQGPRIVCDAACASSLFALQQAMMAIRLGRIDAAIVGGATTNGVDNLILFSQSQACSEQGSRPFDQGASGLISSEGYAAIVVTRLSRAREYGLPILAVISGLGISSDGRGKSLWAPRAEGQQLAVRRAYPEGTPLAIDYLEAHATSTQLGDATELSAVQSLLSDRHTDAAPPVLLIGSVKSNLGHTLETAGLTGLIKVLLSMRRGEIPASLNFERPNANFDWSSGRIEVVSRLRPWEAWRGRRAAAVSAFGIGGLNAHVCVQESPEPAPLSGTRPSETPGANGRPEPIAIVGRGVVLPGAHDVTQFEHLIDSGRSVIGPAPPDRWRSGIGLHPGAPPRSYAAPTSHGGYIRNYTFDAQPYRIPPKQVKQANPIQMMLLDAVSQAAGEYDQGKWAIDRQRTGVVIGTIFGGEFGSGLQLGLRLPEIARELKAALKKHGVSAQEIATIAEDYRQHVLAARPALLDETGSFTASTLASRIAKTFDLMGGACAIDVDDASGLAALQHALDQLRVGNWDLAVCGAAQRAMDLATFEQLDLRGQLVRSGRPEDVPADGSRILPGEGVAVLLLRRLSDAEAAGERILGIIDGLNVRTARDAGTEQGVQGEDTALIRQIGYLTGAQSLVRIVKATVLWHREEGAGQPSGQSIAIASRTEDGLLYQASCRSPKTTQLIENSGDNRTFAPSNGVRPGNSSTGSFTTENTVTRDAPRRELRTASLPSTDLFPRHASPSDVRTTAPSTLPRVVRLFASTEREFLQCLDQALADPGTALTAGPREFPGTTVYRGMVLAASPSELSDRLKGLRRSWERGKRRGVLETERAVLWTERSERPRIAWVFPGQGSQYDEVPAALARSNAAQQRLAELNRELALLGMKSLDPAFAGSEQGTRGDIWQNQIWVLGVSLALSAELQALGARPDMVLGHSFGEYAALVAAGVLSLTQVVRMVKARSDAVATTVQEAGQLISVRGTPAAVQSVIRDRKLPAIVTHFNAPQQTVIASDCDQTEAVRGALTDAGFASIVVPVPVAYHTPRLAQAEHLLHTTFGSERFYPPHCGFLSTTSARYLAEPELLRESLVSQLTRPVLYVPCVERLLGDGFGVLIEVGPNNVLSRMNQEIAGERALCLSLDVPGRDHTERVLMCRAVMEIVSAPLASRLPLNVSAPRLEGTQQRSSPAATDEVEIVDLRRIAQREQPRPPDQRESRSAAAADATPVKPAPAAVQQAQQEPAAVRSDVAEIRTFLRNVVVDLTGYSPDVVDFEADLEADLGIDSIKKAQIVGELAECFGLSVAPEGVRLGDLRTLAEIAGLASHTARRQTAESILPTPEVAIAAPQDALPRSAPRHVDADAIQRFLIDLVVDQTGYSPDVVDLDADLEADLGIDSIKQAQLLGEVQQHFDLHHISEQRTTLLSSYPTLRSILEFLKNELAAESVTSPPAPSHDAAEPLPKPQRLPDVVAPSVVAVHGADSADAPAWSVTSSTLSADIRGLAGHDELPAQWTELFTSLIAEANGSTDWEQVRERGRRHRQEIRAALRLLIDRGEHASSRPAFTPEAQRAFAGLATGAGVAVESVQHAAAILCSGVPSASGFPRILKALDENGDNGGSLRAAETVSVDGRRHNGSDHAPLLPPPVNRHSLSSDGVDEGERTMPLHPTASMRFALRMAPAPQREGMPTAPRFTGAALILGQNPLADAIARQFEATGLAAHRLPRVASLDELNAWLDALWTKAVTPHLFLVSSHDDDALRELNAEIWQERRFTALEVPYRVCQLWTQRMIDADAMDTGSVIAVTNLGGDFGFSGRSAVSPEGGIAGLIKAMLIEGWMRGYRATPMKVIDVSPETTPAEAVKGIWRELAVPSYDMEVALRGSDRYAVQPYHHPLNISHPSRNGRRHNTIRRGGVWVVTGGGRGITAVVAQQFASRHGLKLHLVGTAPCPQVGDDLRDRAARDRLQLRRDVMAEANRRGQNGMEAWRNVEKALEIDATLELFRQSSLEATYHSCDVSNLDQLRRTLDRIRETDGPIDGVIHGAGIGQDARFDRKRPDKVDQCLRAKIDGCINLMDATWHDPLQWFVTFGSISGRFGANGHTDYSLANDTMAKLIDCYRGERPDVSSVNFHWHAWGDIGMATKPETKLALEMINLEFMPAREGIAHFLNEFEYGGDEPEVLITDRAYYRKFFPVDRSLPDPAELSACFPILDAEGQKPLSGGGPFDVELDPQRERFLSQHLVQGRPTLPFVVALEMMAEAARATTGQSTVLQARDVEALQAVKWPSASPLTVRVTAQPDGTGSVTCELRCDVRRRDGRLVEKDRTYFRGIWQAGEPRAPVRTGCPDLSDLNWERVEYLEPDAAIYHGPDLQCLRSIAVVEDAAYGQISASSTVQLGGGHRPTSGWSVHCAVMDACLYAAALFAGKQVGKASLPVSFQHIRFGRLPDPGEPCVVIIRRTGEHSTGLRLDFELIGWNGDRLLDVQGYRIAWLN